MRSRRREFLALGSLAIGAALTRRTLGRPSLASRTTRNVVLVTLDGFRPEEMFTGAEVKLLSKEAGVADPKGFRRRFWRESPENRRETLLPFVWGTVARQGQLFGHAAKGSVVRVTNGRNFSYPGYNEILTGAPDGRIDSNAKTPNPNVSVLEWLNRKPDYRGQVAAFGSWDVFPFILNQKRSGLPINSGWEPIAGDDLTDRQQLLNRMMAELPHRWEGVRLDALTFEAALEHVRLHKPRVLYLALGETDDFAHDGRYDFYLDSAHRSDAMIRRLWETLQSHPQYRGTTSLVLTTDHGRGGLPDGWKGHGASVPGSDRIWVGLLGPDTPPLGERSGVGDVTQSQVAATVAALLGEDFRKDFPEAAPPIVEAVGTESS